MEAEDDHRVVSYLMHFCLRIRVQFRANEAKQAQVNHKIHYRYEEYAILQCFT